MFAYMTVESGLFFGGAGGCTLPLPPPQKKAHQHSPYKKVLAPSPQKIKHPPDSIIFIIPPKTSAPPLKILHPHKIYILNPPLSRIKK